MTRESRFAASYYDGETSRPQPIEVEVREGRLRVVGDGIDRECALTALRVSERLAAAPRLITFPDGAYIETREHAAMDEALANTGFRDSWVVRWQNHWPLAVLALVLTVATLWLGYRYALPAGAEFIAARISPEVEAAIGQRSVLIVDRRLFSPTRLPQAQRDRLAQRFAEIAPKDARDYRIEFRRSSIGPNALALPGGVIVMTDELVQIMPSEEAVLAVLAHELGHIEHRHFLRRLISSTVTGAAATLITGDAGGVMSALPAALAELSYARDQELQADAYAVELMRANGLPAEALATALQTLEAEHERRDSGSKGAAGSDVPPRSAERKSRWTGYLATHPDTDERIAAIRAAAAR